jgi:hypothetical protein
LDGGVEDEFPEFSENVSSVVEVVVSNIGLVIFPVWSEFEGEKKGISDNDFAQVSPIEGGEKVELFQVNVEGAVFVGSLDVSVNSDWVVYKDLEKFNGVKEVKDVSNPGVHGLNNIVGNVETVGVLSEELAVGSVLRSENESIPPGGTLIVSNIFVGDRDTVLSVWVTFRESLLVGSLKSIGFSLWSGSQHVHLIGGWVDKVNKTSSMLGSHRFLNITQVSLGGSRDISSSLSKRHENSGKHEKSLNKLHYY